jgi:hypothetical protein
MNRIMIEESIVKEWERIAYKKGKLEQLEKEKEFLEAITKWRSWDRMSIHAKVNIENRIVNIKEEINKINI